jgi:hypothetical protein
VKRAIFLTGAMGAGKSTIIERATFVEQAGYLCRCQEFDILGRKQLGADSLSGDNKAAVWASLADYAGKLVIAGQYYSAQKDIGILQGLGFELACILLNVPRDVVYDRVLKRGSGGWNENTYASNMRSRISFFKAFPGPKAIWRNETIAESEANFRKLCQL